jgi:hypothetical protein
MKTLLRSLVSSTIASLVLLLKPIGCKAQEAPVNMNILASVARSCQKDATDPNYYKQMDINPPDFAQAQALQNSVRNCITSRYHYSLLINKYPWLVSTGDILPNYPGSVSVGYIGSNGGSTTLRMLDCVGSKDPLSEECRAMMYISQVSNNNGSFDYLPYVCPRCVVAHNEVSGSQEKILQGFIQWFLSLKIPQRRAINAFLGDDAKAYQLRAMLFNESQQAAQRYEEIRAKVEQQELEQRRNQLLGQ